MAPLLHTSETLAEPPGFFVRYRMKITLLMPALLLGVAWCAGPATLAAPWWAGGIACVVLGIALRLWASGYLRKEETLIRWGPFAFLRNPLYAGTFLIGSGFALLTGRWESLPLLLAGMLAVYLPTARYEERILLARFGEAFRDYCRVVPPWFPRLTRPAAFPAGEPFSWSLLYFNGEHRHLILQLALLGVFYLVHLVKG